MNIIAGCVTFLTLWAFLIVSFIYFNPQFVGRWMAGIKFGFETELNRLRREWPK